VKFCQVSSVKAKLRLACHAFTLQEAEWVKDVVILTPPSSWTCRSIQGYPGEGEPLPHGDPPIPLTGCLPRPLGHSVPRTADWVDVCPLEDIRFRELHELAKATPPTERTWEMNTTFWRIQAQRCVDNPKPDRTGLESGLAPQVT
jgi:hypothetical protein